MSIYMAQQHVNITLRLTKQAEYTKMLKKMFKNVNQNVNQYKQMYSINVVIKVSK